MDQTWQVAVAASGSRLDGGARARAVLVVVAALAVLVAWALVAPGLLLRSNGPELTHDVRADGITHQVGTHAGTTWLVRYDQTILPRPRCTVDGRPLEPTTATYAEYGGDYVALGQFRTTSSRAAVRCSGPEAVIVGPEPVSSSPLSYAVLFGVPLLAVLAAAFLTRRRRQGQAGSVDDLLSASNAA